jgi:spermidine/putrescine transport system ATP-binding protein
VTTAPPAHDVGPPADLIIVERLVKSYGLVQALAGVSMTVRRGEFLSVLGPSGCGKTTLLRAIAGFVVPTSGEILIDGRSMLSVPPHLRPVNTVFQHYALFPHMTVADNVAYGPRRHHIGKAETARRVERMLVAVGMESYGGRYPRELSGGQQQRVALARALVNEPQVLLLDEPLGALDLKLRKRMQIELKRLHESFGMTFIYVTHDQEEALTMSDRIAVMNHGQIVQLSSGAELYHNPVSRYVADFIGEANLIGCTAEANGTVRLEGSGETLPFTSPQSGPVSLMVRPEHIEIGDAQAGSDAATLSAQVRDVSFVGQNWRVFAVLASGQEITLLLRASARAERLGVGHNVTIWWPRHCTRVLTT